MPHYVLPDWDGTVGDFLAYSDPSPSTFPFTVKEILHTNEAFRQDVAQGQGQTYEQLRAELEEFAGFIETYNVEVGIVLGRFWNRHDSIVGTSTFSEGGRAITIFHAIADPLFFG